jgi:DNA-binding NarL/FixJ family response regulator
LRFSSESKLKGSGSGSGGDQSLSVAQRSPGGAILRHMKVEEIAEAVAKLAPDQRYLSSSIAAFQFQFPCAGFRCCPHHSQSRMLRKQTFKV